ncbi:ABC transporter ATP-binding protein [Campylobacter sp. FMV-PI01]|uniref:ABC transporter ATP-binding protein n=1 Tax=Campylobacter portucalensis TaxID=2608384 RepID=A0A6L5WLU9_9BACT|nr:ABC transporter ATP-binding protein [Campylobacter portucalensis]MSN96783.1 ABC transporter ATP-binding protein [Campylobacter portucalensis]
MSIIGCRNLNFSYKNRSIYNNFSLEINRGEVVGLLGKNGVGKSTFLNLLTGNLTPKSGEIFIFDTDIKHLSNDQKSKIGILYEGFVCYDYLKISQIHNLYRYFYQEKFKDDIFLDFLDKLKVDLKRYINTLSCGQKSQVVLALLLSINPEILILDDYSLGIDAGYRSLFLEYLKNYIKDKTKTILLTTHIVSNLDEILTKMVVLQNDKKPIIMDVKDFQQNFNGYLVDGDFRDENLNITSMLQINKNEKKIYGFFELNDKQKIKMDFEEAFLGLIGRY